MNDALREKLIYVVQKTFWPLVGIGVVAIVVSLGWSYKNKQDIAQLKKSQNELFVIRKEVEKTVLSLEPKEDPKKLSAKVPPAAEKPKLAPQVYENAYAPLVPKLQVFINANQGTQTAVEAALLVAELTQEYNKPEMAIEPLTTALKGLPSNLFLYGVAQTELGNLYAKANKCLEAAQAWEKVVNEKTHTYLAGNLRLKAGVCYEKQAQLDKAEKLYQEVVDKEPGSFSGRTAKKFLLHLKYLKSKSMATGASASSKNG